VIWLVATNILEKYADSIFGVDVGSRFFENTVNHQPDCKVK